MDHVETKVEFERKKQERLHIPRCKVISIEGTSLDSTDHRRARLMVKQGVAKRLTKSSIQMLREVGTRTALPRA